MYGETDTHHKQILKSISLNYAGYSKLASLSDSTPIFTFQIDDLQVTADDIMEFLGLAEKKKDKPVGNKCTCERCTGMPLESLYEEDE